MILVTGGAGFLGKEVLALLALRGERVRTLALPGDPLISRLPKGVEVCEGDLLNPADLDRFFERAGEERLTVIHCASLITMSMGPVDKVYKVNVQGTENIIARCLENKADRLIHVASVHAITEKPDDAVMAEPESLVPDSVVGYYAQTKALAAKKVMEAREKNGLKANIVYPAGLCGPGDYGKGNLTQLFLDYMDGGIPMAVKGGYNFADVRDVAAAIALLAEKGREGEDYVLAGEYISVLDILQVFHEVTGRKKVTARVPLWLARLALPFLSLVYKIRGVKPIFSAYSLYTVNAACNFSSQKAERELDYRPRPVRESLRDTARWLMENKLG